VLPIRLADTRVEPIDRRDLLRESQRRVDEPPAPTKRPKLKAAASDAEETPFLLECPNSSEPPSLLATLHPGLALVSAPDAPDADGFASLSLTAPRDAPDLREPLVNALAHDTRFRRRALTRTRHTLEDVFLAATNPKTDGLKV
jgi:hypothetical protein